jgi:hypothetical protein
VSSTDRPNSPCTTGLDVNTAAYGQAVRAALADAPALSPDVHARLRAILAQPTSQAAELVAVDASAELLGNDGCGDVAS